MDVKLMSGRKDKTRSKRHPAFHLVLGLIGILGFNAFNAIAAPVSPTDNTSAPYLGFYGWNLNKSEDSVGWNYGINRLEFTSRWLNRSEVWTETFCGSSGATETEAWSSLAMPNFITTGARNWLTQYPNGTLVITMGMFPSGFSPAPNYANSISGSVSTSYYTMAANRLVAAGATSATPGGFNHVIIRLGHEFNLGNSTWKVTHRNSDIDPATGNKYDDRPENFVALFQKIVTTMRAVAPNLKFCWNGCNAYTTYPIADAYPGDAYVDYVATDVYDQSWLPTDQSYPYSNATYPYGADALTRQQNAWNNWIYPASPQNGIMAWKNIAVAHNKPFAIPEWGLAGRTDGHGGLDNPYFIQQMYNFIQDPANNVAFHVYFDVPAADGDHQLASFPAPNSNTKFPVSAALFRKLFGVAPLPFGNDIGTVGIAGTRDPVTVKGAGAGFLSGGTSDNFYFTSRPQTGDGTFVAQITAMTAGTGSQSGVMLRQSTAANAPYAALYAVNGQCVFQSRSTAGGAAVSNSAVALGSLPVSLKLTRIGNAITAYKSNDGLNWVYVGSQTVAMTGTNNFGIAVSSGSTASSNTTSIDNVDNLDINVAQTAGIANAIIKDNSDTTGITVTGGWTPKTDGGGFQGSNYLWLYHGSPLSTIKYTPTIPTSGRYDTYMRWAVTPNRSSNVLTTVTSTAGATQLLCNQYVGAFQWIHLGTYDYAAGTAGNVLVSSADCDGYAATADAVMFVPVPTPSLPSPKVDTDIGSPSPAGSATYAGGVYTVKGAGTGFWGAGPSAVDQFNFVNQPLTGSQTLIARITGFTNTGTNASAGLMFRGGVSGGDVFGQIEINPAGGVIYMFRSTSGAGSSSTGAAVTHVPTPGAPIWLKLVKSGNTITGYYNATSVTTPAAWTTWGSATLTNMPANFLGGLAVHSHSAGTLTTVTYDNVTP